MRSTHAHYFRSHSAMKLFMQRVINYAIIKTTNSNEHIIRIYS